MRIDRHPNRGPYVAALICLLTLCLTIPILWQAGASRTDALRSGIGDYDDGLGNDYSRIDGFAPRAASELPGYGPAETLNQMLARLTGRPSGAIGDKPDLLTELLASPAETSFLWPWFHRAGREVAQFSPAELVSVGTRHLVFRKRLSRRSDPLPTHSLLLINPNERVAATPSIDVDAFDTPWCAPAVLIERLEVLAQHPYSAEWARQTIDEVRSITENDRPSTGAVAAQLGRLNTLANQAVELADAATDDRLRAELLRAHWGLARRLECWSLMRDIVVASAAANRFAARVPWNASENNLSGQGTEPTDMRSLSGELELYERVRTPRLARAIVVRQQLLAQSNDPRQLELADQIELNYRNANVRLAFSAEMLDRFMPLSESEISPVRDRIAGTPVRGRSETTAENTVRLEPDTQRWRLGLEADGTVDSQTVADGGAAQVRTRGTAEFSAKKAIVVEHDGVRLGPTTADVQCNSRLVGIHSSFDWIPFVGQMVRSRAMQEYHSKQPRAQAEIEYKVARRVEAQMDERADQALDKMEQRLQDQVTGPLEAVGVAVTPIELSTTDQRVIARLRVAGQEQLAGHTPRPRAPADSLASVQLHESALTNAALSLNLEGKRLTAPELQALMREKFSRKVQQTPMSVEEDTIFEFAGRDAVRFRVSGQRLEMILAMTEVVYEDSPVRSFRVHAFYRPVILGLEAEFVRDGALGIEGRIRTGERARMHGVFNKVLTEDRRLPIVRLEDPNDRRLAGLMITQMVLEDGWIGLAVGPNYIGRTAERSRTLR